MKYQIDKTRQNMICNFFPLGAWLMKSVRNYQIRDDIFLMRKIHIDQEIGVFNYNL